MDKFVIIILIMITGTRELCECCIESERNGLLQIKSSFNPNSPNALSSWDTSDPDCCNWDKLHCNYETGRVIFLDLSLTDFDSGDSWYLNASLFLPFSQLNALHLGYNNIAGCIHNEGFERLSSTLTNLEFLLLMNNRFNNTILQSLSGFSSLKVLYLTDNKLNGTINIAELNNLKSTLQTLDLGENEIEGFENMQVKFDKLDYLVLSYNRFNSSIFPFLRELSSLNGLDLGYNNFKGPFNFTEIDGLSNLQELELSGNEITEFIVSKDLRGPMLNLSILYLDNMTSTAGISNLLQHFPALNTLSLRYNDFRGLQVFGEESLKKLEKLDLSYSQFNQTTNAILRSIGRMSSLKRLSITGCGLSGCIASQGLCDSKDLSRNFSDLNDLNDNLPWSLSNLTSLQYLHLSHNLFKIPISLSPFFNLSQLTQLFIDNNTIYADTKDHNLNPKFQLEYLSINGYGDGEAFPKFLYHQHNLHYVILSNLKLRGEFPYWLLQNNTGLGHLDLSNNSLSGNLRLPYKAHESTIHLDVSNNFINGSIPSQIGDLLPYLSSLIMNKNEFKGSIPNSLCKNLPFFQVLDLSQNNISGTIPNCIGNGNLSQLKILDLSYNKVSGNLPSNFSSSFLKIINLSNNKLQGSLKDAFYPFAGLFQLDLSHNNFSGSIPSSIEILSQLSFLVLGHNNLQGEIPIELCKLKQLSFIDLSHNNIVGHMLSCLNITSYWSREQIMIDEIKDIEITMKGQPYKYSKTILSYISGIDISHNYLTGQIPIEIGELRSIKSLNMSRNRLTGTIPPTFSSLREIESLDLSHNNLQGKIPPQLTQLTSLAVFDVSYNNLSGQIPNKVAQFGTFSELSYRGNPFLCGWPLLKSCSPLDSPPPDNDESINWFIDMEDFFVSFGVAYATVFLTLGTVLCINPYWRRVWFYYVQMSIDTTYYFILDNVIPLFLRF